MPEAKTLLVGAVKKMTVEDARAGVFGDQALELIDAVSEVSSGVLI